MQSGISTKRALSTGTSNLKILCTRRRKEWRCLKLSILGCRRLLPIRHLCPLPSVRHSIWPHKFSCTRSIREQSISGPSESYYMFSCVGIRPSSPKTLSIYRMKSKQEKFHFTRLIGLKFQTRPKTWLPKCWNETQIKESQLIKSMITHGLWTKFQTRISRVPKSAFTMPSRR